MNRSILIFCGQPLVGAAIGQRLGAFGAYLRRQGWCVHLASVDPHFQGEPFSIDDVTYRQRVDIIGPTHYRMDNNCRRIRRTPSDYFAECRHLTKRLVTMVRKFQPDIVLISTSLPASLFAVTGLPVSPHRLWMDIDDWSTGQFAVSGGGGLVGLMYGELERWIPKRAHRITVCSQELSSLYPNSILIPNFINLHDIPAMVRSASGPVRVAFPGSVTAYHGQEHLIRVLARRRSEIGGMELVIAGGGDELESCRRLVGELGMEETIHLPGPLPRTALLSALSEMAVGVLPMWDNRVNRARFPLKLLDYLACGCAIAASDVGMAHETLTNGQTALLSPPGDMNRLVDSILEMVRSPLLCSRLAVNGLELVRKYDEEVVCSRWMQALQAG